MATVDSSLASQCMDFCQALASQNKSFTFSLTVGLRESASANSLTMSPVSDGDREENQKHSVSSDNCVCGCGDESVQISNSASFSHQQAISTIISVLSPPLFFLSLSVLLSILSISHTTTVEAVSDPCGAGPRRAGPPPRRLQLLHRLRCLPWDVVRSFLPRLCHTNVTESCRLDVDPYFPNMKYQETQTGRASLHFSSVLQQTESF